MSAPARRSASRASRGWSRCWTCGGRITTLHAAEQERPDVVAARAAFREAVAPIPVEDLVFLDESGATTALVRRYARAEGGRRAVGRVPAGHWTQLTILSVLSLAGLGATM